MTSAELFACGRHLSKRDGALIGHILIIERSSSFHTSSRNSSRAAIVRHDLLESFTDGPAFGPFRQIELRHVETNACQLPLDSHAENVRSSSRVTARAPRPDLRHCGWPKRRGQVQRCRPLPPEEEIIDDCLSQSCAL